MPNPTALEQTVVFLTGAAEDFGIDRSRIYWLVDGASAKVVEQEGKITHADMHAHRAHHRVTCEIYGIQNGVALQHAGVYRALELSAYAHEAARWSKRDWDRLRTTIVRSGDRTMQHVNQRCATGQWRLLQERSQYTMIDCSGWTELKPPIYL